jgi:glycosyltransferase involved in cell wall biosynthesis
MVVMTAAASPLRIAHLLAPAPLGGLESVVRGLAGAQHERGHEVIVAASLTPDTPVPRFLTELAELGVNVRVLRVHPRAYATEVRLIRELSRELRPDVAHTHGYRSDLVAGHAAHAEGVPLVTTVHGFTSGDWKNQAYQALQRLAFRRFDAVVAVSRAIAERVVRWGARRERVHLIPNGYVAVEPARSRSEARAALGIADSAFRFGWVGRVYGDKGPDVLIEALGRLPELDWQLSVIGEGPDLPAVRARAATLGIGGRVSWHGTVPRAGGLMAAFDAFVLSSRTEGTPMVLLEAMAAGTPVAATTVGGVPDVVGPGEALLVPPEDPAALAAALRSLMQDAAAARGRAAAATERLRAYDAGLWLDRYDTVYRGVARALGAPAGST